MNPLIGKALKQGRVLQFRYKGQLRSVEPHTYGRKFDGVNALCGWQISGGSGQDFRMYLEREMSEVILTEVVFDKPRAGYRPEDPRFAIIWAELKL